MYTNFQHIQHNIHSGEIHGVQTSRSLNLNIADINLNNDALFVSI